MERDLISLILLLVVYRPIQQTPLHVAACEGHEEIVSYLVGQAANKEAMDKAGVRKNKTGIVTFDGGLVVLKGFF